MITRHETSIDTIRKETPFICVLFPDVYYYSIHPVRAQPRGIVFYAEPEGKLIQSFYIRSSQGKHYLYVKLHGDRYCYSPGDLFETYEDAMVECIERNQTRNLNKLIDINGDEVLYTEVLQRLTLPPKPAK